MCISIFQETVTFYSLWAGLQPFHPLTPTHTHHQATSRTGGQLRAPVGFALLRPSSRIAGGSQQCRSSSLPRTATPTTTHNVSPWPLLHRHPQQQATPPPLLKTRGGGFVLEPAVVKASLTAVGELLISCGIGAWFTRRGIMNRTVISSLSTVVYWILLPALLVVNVARTVYSTPLTTLLPLPMFATMQIILCSGIARVVTALLGVDVNSLKGRQLRVCQTFGNSGVAPILFATVLLRNHPDPAVLPLAISYISFYLLGWTPIFWTVGFRTLVGPDPQTPEEQQEEAAAKATRTTMAAKLKHLVQHPPPAIPRVFSPPILGSVGGLLLGISPMAKWFLGPKAPLGMLTNAAQTIGSAYTSTGLLVLAGSLALPLPTLSPAEEAAEAADTASGRASNIHPFFQIASVCLVRFCLCPALFLSIILKLMGSGLVKLDRLMLFVLFLQSCMPSAQNTVHLVFFGEVGGGLMFFMYSSVPHSPSGHHAPSLRPASGRHQTRTDAAVHLLALLHPHFNIADPLPGQVWSLKWAYLWKGAWGKRKEKHMQNCPCLGACLWCGFACV